MTPEVQSAISLRGFQWLLPPECPPTISQVLFQRGVVDELDKESFLRPSLSQLTDPLEIPDLEKGARRVLEARDRREKVCVFADYDVDGISGGAQLVEAFRAIGVEVFPYIPNRFQEGYGLNTSAVQAIADQGAKVIVTVDCGISNVLEAAAAKTLGIDLVITDHHTLPPQLPDAFACVHAGRIPGDHPSKQLSGSGVAFKFAWGVLKLDGRASDGTIRKLLDLVCLGTLADMVPLQKENRILASHGLRQLNQRTRVGLRALAEVSGTRGNLAEWHVLFIIGPRLNAAGRLYEAQKSMDLLLEQDPLRAREIAKELHAINAERRDVGDDVEEQIEAQIAREELAGDPLLFLVGEGWHPGVVGIAAARIAERYRRPTVVLTVWEGMGRASARSIPGVNVYKILEAGKDIYRSFGGHFAAAGFTILPEKIPALETCLEESAKRELDGNLPVPELKVDLTVTLPALTMSFVQELHTLAPFGEGNPEPVIVVRDLELKQVKTLSSPKHVKMMFTQEGRDVTVVGFGWGEHRERLEIGRSYDVAMHVRLKEWNGFESLEYRLVDMRLS